MRVRRWKKHKKLQWTLWVDNVKKFAVIGGSGFYKLITGNTLEVTTPYGSVRVAVGNLDDAKVAFLTRHEEGHKTPPHAVNYRANIFALNKLGYRNIFSTSAAGIICDYMPGDLVLVRDF